MTSFLSLPLAPASLATAARARIRRRHGHRHPEDDLTDALTALARVDAACAAQLARIDLAWDRILAKGLTPNRPATRAAFEGEVQTEWLALKAKGDAVIAGKKKRKQRKREKAAAQQKAAGADGGVGEANGSRHRRAKGKNAAQ
ncbi:hypothetical protein DFH06DRAFT_1322569 [Mycena polygramma]|nr:hypothetical protein DFH06DRAFT_1322569 [Mycena polygramma]